jgi:hypothetical protein
MPRSNVHHRENSTGESYERDRLESKGAIMQVIPDCRRTQRQCSGIIRLSQPPEYHRQSPDGLSGEKGPRIHPMNARRSKRAIVALREERRPADHANAKRAGN